MLQQIKAQQLVLVLVLVLLNCNDDILQCTFL
jgi:hypothetical protein